MADIQYLNYGDLQIELLALLNNLANLVQGYVQKQPWSNKRKEMFMSAYSELMNRGILGASNTTGQWMLNVGGDTPLNLDSKSKKEKEMYLEAAYFIQQQMAGLPTKTSQEEKKKEDLPVFDNKYFTSELIKHISNKDYGGLDILMGNGEKENDWNRLDARDEKGIRGRKHRADALARYLREYSDSLDESKLSFEGSPFANLDDFKGRINKAIEALGTESTEDDIPALNAIGLSASTWFNNGSGDPYKTKGYEGTYGDYYGRFLPQLEKDKAKAEAEKLKAIRANQFDNYRFFNFLNGTPGSLEDFNLIGLKLSGQQALDGNDISKISWAFKQGIKNGGLTNLSKEELSKFGSRYISTPNRLKKLPGLEGIYYDSYANRLIQPFKGLQLTGANLSGILELNSPETLAKKELEDKLKAANRELSKGLEAEDYLRMGAMALDIAGGITAWGGPFGMATSGILGLTSLGTNMLADSFDESLSKWDVAKNAGVNLGLAAVGMVPGLGLASKTGKWLTNIAKWAPRLLTIQALKDTPEVYASIKKAVDTPSKVTNQDWKNIAYGLSITAGLSRGVKGIVNNRKYKPTVTQNTEKQYIITTSKGKKTISLELVDKIKKLDFKDKEKANEKLKEILKLSKDETVDINNSKSFGNILKTKGIDIKEKTVPIGQSPEVLRYSRALAIKNIRDKAAHPFLSKYLPTNYDIYLSAARVSAPNINIVDRVKQAWNPVPNRPFKGTKLQSSSSSNSSNTPISTGANVKPKLQPKLPALSQSESKELLSTLRGRNFSNNNTTEVLTSVKGFGDVYGINESGGKFSLQFELKDGTKIKINPQDSKNIKSETLKVIRKDIMKKIDSQIPKEQRSRIKFELVRLLKLNGYLKQGGTIDKQKIQKYKEFIKK